MTRKKAEQLLTVDIQNLSLLDLQRYRVDVLDAWRQSQAEYGYSQAVKDGYYIPISSESASGFSPVNIWLSENLSARFSEIESRLKDMY